MSAFAKITGIAHENYQSSLDSFFIHKTAFNPAFTTNIQSFYCSYDDVVVGAASCRHIGNGGCQDAMQLNIDSLSDVCTLFE